MTFFARARRLPQHHGPRAGRPRVLRARRCRRLSAQCVESVPYPQRASGRRPLSPGGADARHSNDVLEQGDCRKDRRGCRGCPHERRPPPDPRKDAIERFARKLARRLSLCARSPYSAQANGRLGSIARMSYHGALLRTVDRPAGALHAVPALPSCRRWFDGSIGLLPDGVTLLTCTRSDKGYVELRASFSGHKNGRSCLYNAAFAGLRRMGDPI